MLFQDLYENVLVAPARSVATELLIVSGYATAAMAQRHLALEEIAGNDVRIRLICGMASHDGIRQADHAMFGVLQERGFFECHYRVERPRIHAKVYVWLRNGQPTIAFAGSANYSQTAFLPSGGQIEVMVETDPDLATKFFENYLRGSMEIGHDDIENQVALLATEPQSGPLSEGVDLTLVTSQGEVGVRSGLNWGQRPGRDHNQAYIPVPARIGGSGFFPEQGTQFTILTDDGFSFIGAIAQQGGKAIHSHENNSILGKYIRDRLGLPSGEFVARQHLENYGRTTVTFTKFDDETYYMDFSLDN